MKLKIFTIAFNDQLQKFDTDEMDLFLQEKNIIEIEKHYQAILGMPYWTILVQYTDTPTAKPRREKFASDNPLLVELATWRAESAKIAGIPPYIIATNAQLVQIAEKKVQTLKGLEQINGFGPKKIGQYGKQMLEIILKHCPNG